MTTELNPTTHAPVNHDAARRQRELDLIMKSIAEQNPQPSEVPATQAPTAKTVSVDDLPAPLAIPVEPAPVIPAEPTMDWQREAETYKERHRNAERALTPALQKAAAASKALQEERENNAAALRSMQEQLAELKSMLSSSCKEEAPVYRPEDDPDFATQSPEVAERLALITKSFNQRLEQVQKAADERIAAVEAKHINREKELEKERQSLYIQNWDKELRRLVPDLDQFMPGAVHGQALVEWSLGVAPEYARAIGDPYSHTPLFVAQVINAFKVSNGIIPLNGKKPSLGDLANPALTGSSRVSVEPPEPANLLTDYEFANIRELTDKAFREKDHKRGQDLLARYEKTLLIKQQR